MTGLVPLDMPASLQTNFTAVTTLKHSQKLTELPFILRRKGKGCRFVYNVSTRSVSIRRSGIARIVKGITQFYLHILRFIRKRTEIYLPLLSQPQLVLICRPRRDGRLSRPWCELAQAAIRTCNLPIVLFFPSFVYYNCNSERLRCWNKTRRFNTNTNINTSNDN